MRNPTVDRTQFVRVRKENARLRRELRDTRERGGLVRKGFARISDSYRSLKNRYRFLVRLGRFALVKDMGVRDGD